MNTTKRFEMLLDMQRSRSNSSLHTDLTTTLRSSGHLSEYEIFNSKNFKIFGMHIDKIGSKHSVNLNVYKKFSLTSKKSTSYY